jgi:hypothetical protein
MSPRMRSESFFTILKNNRKTDEHLHRLKKLEGEFDHNTRMIDLRRKQLEVALVTLNDFQKSIEELTK